MEHILAIPPAARRPPGASTRGSAVVVSRERLYGPTTTDTKHLGLLLLVGAIAPGIDRSPIPSSNLSSARHNDHIIVQVVQPELRSNSSRIEDSECVAIGRPKAKRGTRGLAERQAVSFAE